MKEFISYRQSVFLLSMILPITGHMLLLPSIFSLSGRDAWIAIVVTMPLGLLFGFVLFRLHTLHPSKTLVEMLEHGFGRIIGKGLTVGLVAYFLYMLVITLYGLFDFIQVVFLPETPRWAISIAFYMVVLYGIRVGIESVARMSQPLVLLIIITGGSIGIATIPVKDHSNLFPLFEHGWVPLLSGILVTTAFFGECVILLMLKLKKDYSASKSLLLTNSVLIILVTIMFLGTVTSTLMIFGEQQVKNLEYPAQSVVRIVEFGFLERFDIYGIGVMVVGCVVRMSTFQMILNLGIRQWLGINHKWWIHASIAVMVFVMAFKGISNHRQFTEILMTKYYPLTAIISVGLPILTWIVLEVKNKINKGSSYSHDSRIRHK
ncbi:MAG: endospore germination permease [Paenibacillaceae bacterium]